MGYWENLIDVYESWDYDSLVEEAYQISCAVRDDINRHYNVNDPLFAAIMIGAYFMDADGMVDGVLSVNFCIIGAGGDSLLQNALADFS